MKWRSFRGLTSVWRWSSGYLSSPLVMQTWFLQRELTWRIYIAAETLPTDLDYWWERICVGGIGFKQRGFCSSPGLSHIESVDISGFFHIKMLIYPPFQISRSRYVLICAKTRWKFLKGADYQSLNNLTIFRINILSPESTRLGRAKTICTARSDKWPSSDGNCG